ncbi:MAG TPA: Uma2 family endonuclease [Isosphaeraceae bacterium]|nr:Uma2 family endonuclease [Isosphaeraceae bacterium]
MTRDPDDAPPPNRVRCPTCRAVQEWSDTCRRCKSDLRLLREFAADYERSRRACLERLRAGHPREARYFARRCHALRAGAESRRLLALAALHCGDWPTAAALARRVLRNGRPEAERPVGFGPLRTRVGAAGGLGVQSPEGPEEGSSMAATTEPNPPAASTDTDRRFVLDNLGWQGYETMLQLVGDRPIRLTYDRGKLELMSPSPEHEKSKRLHDILIQALVEEFEIPCIGAASTTWRREDLDRGLGPDESYYLSDHAEQYQDREIDPRVDPPPDLAIEIDISRSSLDRQAICAALGVPELWRFDGESLRVSRLRADGTYEACATSPAFPFLPLDEVVRFLKQGARINHSRWGRMVREWIRNELVPRYQRRADDAEQP